MMLVALCGVDVVVRVWVELIDAEQLFSSARDGS